METALTGAGILKPRTLECGPSDAELQRTRAQSVGAAGPQHQEVFSASAVGPSESGGQRKRVASPERSDPMRGPAKVGRRYPVTVGGVEIDSASAENQMINALIRAVQVRAGSIARSRIGHCNLNQYMDRSSSAKDLVRHPPDSIHPDATLEPINDLCVLVVAHHLCLVFVINVS